jgi:uncharacterized SAM-binding protein YcdF (DUF218 family)
MKSLVALLVVAAIWTAGLLAFAARVAREAPPEAVPQADGIVALTGASDARIQEAMDLLAANKGRRVLVSGVNRTVTREELRQLTHAPSRLYECCVDLGFDAENTLGNAQEIAAWARAKSFRSLIVVTSDYHMPRSMLEIRGALPGVQLVGYPTVTPSLDARRWWRTGTGARRMALEYCKYLVVFAREAVLHIGDKEAKTTPSPKGPKTAS